MRKTLPALVALLLVCAAAVSCSAPAAPAPSPTPVIVTTSPAAAPTPVPTPPPVPTPTPTPEPTVKPTPTPIPVPTGALEDKNPDHLWEPTAGGRVDIMMIVAHPDDDQLYLGAVIPTYVQQGKSVVTVFMTYSNSKRKQEALNGLYTEGERIYPVFDSLRDDLVNGKWITTMDQARKQWSDSDPLEFLTEQVRKYKPTVIVSMDVNNGEYRHGAHIYTAYLAQQVFDASADRDAYPESYSKYGTWQPAKLYLHLFKENKLTIDTGVPLSVFGGKTALQMAKLGYKCHKSQQRWRFAVSTTRYSICDFGLALSKVGYENTANDMFENIGPDTMDNLNP